MYHYYIILLTTCIQFHAKAHFVSNCPVNIEDIGTQRHFKSNNIPDHHIFCDETLPRPLREVYNSKCDDKPMLTAFDVYRSDGKDSLQYYTNPAYFFDLWVENERKRLSKV